MRASSLEVSYRPVRLGWCVRNNSWDDLRRAIRLTHTLWGGRFNPIIPIENVTAAEDLIKLYGVDALFPIAEEKPVTDFIARFTWLPWPSFDKALFVARDGGADATFLDIYHVVRHLVEDEAKARSKAKLSVTQFVWDSDDPLGDVFLAYFGAYPPKDEISKDYGAFVNRNLRGKLVELATAKQLEPETLKLLTPSELTRYWVEWDSSPVRAGDGVYAGHADDFEDVVNFWNIRAADVELIFYDPRHQERLASFTESFVEPFRNRPTKGIPFEPRMTVWSKQDKGLDVTPFKLDQIQIRLVSTTTWSGFNFKPTRFHLGREKSAFGTITENGAEKELSLHLPEKPFFDEFELHEQKAVAKISSIGLDATEDESVLRVPYLPILNAFYGRRMYFDSKKVRVERDGIAVIEPINKSHINLRSIQKRDLVAEIFKVFGMKAETSGPGRIASRLVAQMGGIQGCRVFKVSGVRNLLESYGPQKHFEKSTAIQTIRQFDPATGVPNFSKYERLFIEPREHGPLTPEQVFTFLLKRGVFQVGMSLSCPHCELEPWIPLDDLATEVSCEYCGKTFLVTPQLRDRNWKYRRSGLFGRENNQEGSVPVVLTLQQLDSALHDQRIFLTNTLIEPISARIEPCETDFVLIEQGFGSDIVSVAIGECKTRKEISDEDVRKLSLVADVFEENGLDAFIVFSKIDPFTADEVARCRAAQGKFRFRVIMLSSRELEATYFLYEQTEKEFVIRASAGYLKGLAESTDSIYFHPRPKPAAPVV